MSQLLIIAIGNGACNIADSLQSQGLESAKFAFLDTDPDDLNNHPGVGDTVLLQGAEQERHAAINRLLSADVERVAIIACLGGRTGTYFTPLAALWNWHDHTDDEYYEEMVMDEVVHHRFRWYHGRRLKALREKHLQPFIEQLVEEARHGPMFDGAFLVSLGVGEVPLHTGIFLIFFHRGQGRQLQFQAVDGYLHPLAGTYCGRRPRHIRRAKPTCERTQRGRHCGRSFDKLLHGCASAIGNERT